jgi:hypothetical protein
LHAVGEAQRLEAVRNRRWRERAEQHDATLLSIASANPDGTFMIDELANAFAAGTALGA